MPVLQRLNKKASARQQIAIKGVKENVLTLPGNRHRMVLSVTPVNFELKSEDEQDAIIDTYQNFLNSVGCPLQILIRTREIDMDKYLDDLAGRLESESEDIYREQIRNYEEFIRSLVQVNKILTRHFYVVVPYNPNGKSEFESIKEQLGFKVDVVRKGLARLGMSSRVLNDLEILDLFYSFYSPEQAKLQPLSEQALALFHTEYVQKGMLHE